MGAGEGGTGAPSISALLPRGRDEAEKGGELRLALLLPCWSPVAPDLWPKLWLMGSKMREAYFLSLTLSLKESSVEELNKEKEREKLPRIIFPSPAFHSSHLLSLPLFPLPLPPTLWEDEVKQRMCGLWRRSGVGSGAGGLRPWSSTDPFAWPCPGEAS